MCERLAIPFSLLCNPFLRCYCGKGTLLPDAGRHLMAARFSLLRHIGFAAVKLLKDAGADPATLLAYLRTLPPQQNKETSVYPAPAERIDSAQRGIAALGR